MEENSQNITNRENFVDIRPNVSLSPNWNMWSKHIKDSISSWYISAYTHCVKNTLFYMYFSQKLMLHVTSILQCVN